MVQDRRNSFLIKKPIIVRREGKEIIIACSDELQAVEIFVSLTQALGLQQKREDEFGGLVDSLRRRPPDVREEDVR